MTQWPHVQSSTTRQQNNASSQQRYYVHTSTSLSSAEIASRIQQTAALTTQQEQQYTGQELVEALTAMYPTSTEARKTPPRIGTIECVYQVPAPISTLAWAPGGKRLALSYAETVMLCDIETKEVVATFSPYVAYKRSPVTITGVAFSPDGKWIAISRSDREVEVQDATTGKYEFMYSGHTQPVHAIAWSHNGDYVATAETGRVIHIWEFGSGKLVSEYNLVNSPSTSPLLTPLMWSTDDKQVVFGCSNHIYLLDDLNGLFVYNVPQIVKAIVQSGDTWYVAVASVNNNYGANLVQLGHLKYVLPGNKWQGAEGHTYTRHQRMVRAVAFSPDSKRIASSSEDLTIQLWNAHDGRDVFTFRMHPVPVTLLSWSPDGKRIASADEQGIVLVWLAG
jgi:WD40 repeat protein